jgi:3-oxoadipate enol-lactonase
MNGTYTRNGARLAYWETGAGLPVIFLHPTPLDGEYWRPMIGQLKGIRAIVPDLRGHGISELGHGLPMGSFKRVPDAPVLTMEQLGSDILALVDHLCLKTAVFAGCSIGGYALLELWRRAPQRVRGAAFVCSKPQPDAEANLVKRETIIKEARAGNKEALFDTMAQTSIGATARRTNHGIVHELRTCMTLKSEVLVAVQAGLAIRPDSVPTVSTINVPILSIAGGEDLAVSSAEMEAFRAARGTCDSFFLPDAGHFAAYEQPENVASLFARWLRQFSD